MVENKKEDSKIKKEFTSKIKKSKKDEEPSWYHYLIVILVFVLIFFAISNFNFFYNKVVPVQINQNITKLPVYKYTHEENGKKYNFEFNSPVDELKNYNVPIEVSKYTMLNSKEITFSFQNYSKLDNKDISISSVKLMRLLKYYFHFSFNKGNFQMSSNFSCLNSTLDNKVLTFNPYQNKSGVFYNQTNGCIKVYSNSSRGVLKVTDKFLFDLVNG